MKKTNLFFLIVFSLLGTACVVPPRPRVVIGQPGVVYRSPTENARGNTLTVTVMNNIAGTELDILVDKTMVIKGLRPGVPETVTFSCNQGVINISLGDNRRRGNTNQQFTLSGVVSRDSVYVGAAQGAPRPNLNCQNNGRGRAQHRAVRWDVQRVQVPRSVD